MNDLTARQRDILDYIVESQRANGFPPTIREIGARFGIKSPNGVASHTNALIRKGFLGQSRHKCRSMTAPRKEVSLEQLTETVENCMVAGASCQVIGVAVASLFGWKADHES